MGWIFQGNPTRFDIDKYLSVYPEYIYWTAERGTRGMKEGDRAFIWRSKPNAGVVAIGEIAEPPVPATEVAHRDALGEELWHEEPDLAGLKAGIRLHEVRLNVEEGMLTRSTVKDSPVLSRTRIIRAPQGTVFRLEGEEVAEMERLWGLCTSDSPQAGLLAIEGESKLVSHFRKERSSWLRDRKLQEYREARGVLSCELCGLSEGVGYPADLDTRVFEVHHRLPLSNAGTRRATRLEDLAVLCANCHRAVHSSDNVEEAFERVKMHFQ
jgi:hypothetical protein